MTNEIEHSGVVALGDGRLQACSGADDPEDRCPRHPSECTCWQIDPDHPMMKRSALSRPVQEPVAITAAEVNAAFDPADEAIGGAFKDGFREGWLFASDPGFDNREELEGDYHHVVDIAPSECWDAYREKYFAMLPLAAIPKISAAPQPAHGTSATEGVVDVPPCWWIDHGSHGQITQREDEAIAAANEGKLVVSYLANALAPVTAGQGVEVKPLEWDGHNTLSLGLEYHVWWYEMGKCWLAASGTRGIGDGFASSDAAKAAAQADYEQRILSTLSAAPQPVINPTHSQVAGTPGLLTETAPVAEIIAKLREDMTASPVDGVTVIDRGQLEALSAALSPTPECGSCGYTADPDCEVCAPKALDAKERKD